MLKLCSCIVWYNPTFQNAQNIFSYINNIDRLIIIDNSDYSNIKLLSDSKLDNNKIIYFPNYENLGIAKAQNQGCMIALQERYKWALLLDQDSFFPEINDYINIIDQNTDKEISIFCPNIENIQNKQGYINATISSGSLIYLDDWKKIGGFDEDFFIDEVDFDFCYKIRNLGKKIFAISDVKMHHKLGNSFSINFFKFKIQVMNHTPLRRYYITRNRLYMMVRYKSKLFLYLFEIFRDFIYIVLFEKNKSIKIYYTILGFIDFLKGKKGKILSSM